MCLSPQSQVFQGLQHLSSTYPIRGPLMWRSVYHECDLMKEELVLRIGDVTQVNVWEDNYIPHAGAMKPIGMSNPSKTFVETLLSLMTMAWAGMRRDWIKFFLSSDTYNMNKTHVGGASRDDYIALNFTRNGVFSVPSTYHLKMSLISFKRTPQSAFPRLQPTGDSLSYWEQTYQTRLKCTTVVC